MNARDAFLAAALAEWTWVPPHQGRPGYFHRPTPSGRRWLIHHDPGTRNERTGNDLPFRLDLLPAHPETAALRTFHGDTPTVLAQLAAELDPTH